MGEPKIQSVFGKKTVAKGVKVDYELVGADKSAFNDGSIASTYAWNWFITYHYLDDDGIDSEFWHKKTDDGGHSIENSLLFTRKWDKVGRHLVQCAAKVRGEKKFAGYASFDQQVAELDAILYRQMEEAKKKNLPNPHAELTLMWKWLYILTELHKQQSGQMTADANERHYKRVNELERNANKLKALLAKCSDEIWPFRAVYLAKDSMEDMPLRVFVTQPRGKTDRLMIVDWTNLDEPKLHGTYEGKFPEWKGRRTAGLIHEAFKEAIDTWKDDNRYWPGGIRYEFYRRIGTTDEVEVTGMIKTGDTTWKEDLAGVLKKIAMGAAIIGLVLTGVGSTLAGAMIVTSMVAGATASVLSIHHRHSRGEGSFVDDAVDVLDIVANVLGVGYRAGKAVAGAGKGAVAWQAGRTLRLKLSDKVLDAMFIGEVWADGFQGLLLGVDFTKKYFEIRDAKNMTPEERASAMLALFGQAAAAGALHGLNNKVVSSIEKAKWNKLMERTDAPDNLVDPPAFKGDTKEGKKTVTVVNKQKRQDPVGVPPAPAPAVPAKPKAAVFPPSDPKIWKRNSVTDNEIDLRTHDGFNFNAHIDHNGYVTVDIQTRLKSDTPPGYKQSPHLGTGRENFDRMFQHFEANGHKIKGWHGIFVSDNYEAVLAALKKNPDPKAAVLESVTGKNFWKPWADSKGLKIVVEDAQDVRAFFSFSVKFEPKK